MNAAQYEELLSMLNDIKFRLDRLSTRLGTPAESPKAAPQAQSQQPAQVFEVATDDDLDGQYGNPEIRKDPPRWKGESQVGKRYSECTPEFLEVLAGFLTWKAGESDKKQETTSGGQAKSYYIRKDAARARGWAARFRAGAGAYRSTAHTSSTAAREEREASGYQPPPQPPPPDDFDGTEDIPF
jgi:hypothetical protein